MTATGRHWLVTSTSIAVVFALCFPIIVLFAVSLNSGVTQAFPPEGVSLRWYFNIFNRSGFISAFKFSLQLAILATLASLLIGTTAAVAIVRYRFRARDALLTLLMSPLIVPQVVVGMAFLLSLSLLRINSSYFGLFIMHVTMCLPFTVRLVVSALMRFKISLEESARSLGASPAKAFFLITLPIIRPGLFAAGVFAFASSWENFTASQFLVWDRTTLPVEIYSYVQTENDPTGAAISALVVLITAILTIALNRFIGIDMLMRR